MAPPIPYTRGTSFTDAQAADPEAPLSGPGIDAEYDRILITINSLITALAEIQRADGALANGSVGADQISPDVYTGLYPAEPWLTGTKYALNRTVLVSGATIKLYRCLESHESSVFANDLAAGYWVELADFTPPPVAGTVPISQGGTGGVTATEARTNLGLGYLATLMTAPIPVGYGGTGGITAAQARASLGVGIGTQVQAYSSVLDAFAGATLAADKLVYGTGASSVAVTDLTSFARTLLDDADAATARGTLAAMKGNQTTVTDWNDALKDGHYYAAGGASNAPTAHAYVANIIRNDDNNLIQVAIRAGTGEVYIRARASGTFGAWIPLASEAYVNDAIGKTRTQNIATSTSSAVLVSGLDSAGRYTISIPRARSTSTSTILRVRFSNDGGSTFSGYLNISGGGNWNGSILMADLSLHPSDVGPLLGILSTGSGITTHYPLGRHYFPGTSSLIVPTNYDSLEISWSAGTFTDPASGVAGFVEVYRG